MSPLRGLVTARREQVMAVAARHHANRVRLVGSVARSDDQRVQDILDAADQILDVAEEGRDAWVKGPTASVGRRAPAYRHVACGQPAKDLNADLFRLAI